MDDIDNRMCRMCFAAQVHLIDIYDEFESNIAEIISTHIGKVSKTDAFPKYICSECWQKTEEFHKFHNSVMKAQENYLTKMVKYEEVETEAHDENVISFENVNTESMGQSASESEDGIVAEPAPVMVTAMEEQVVGSQPEIEAEIDQAFENDFANYDDNIEIDEEILTNIKLDQLDCDFNSDSDEESLASKRDALKVPEVYVDPDKRQEILNNFDTTCDICSVYLGSLKKAITHYKKQHRTDGYIKCCGLKFKKDCLVDDHIKMHIKPDMFRCHYEGCNKIMRTRMSLQVHTSDHRCNFECDICGKTFIRLPKLARHMTLHSNPFVCDICSRVFRFKEKLEHHLQFKHRGDIVKKQQNQLREICKMELNPADVDRIIATHCDMSCDICSVVSKSLPEAQYHYLHEHQNTDGYIKCCSLKFKDVQKLHGHILWHLKPEELICIICSKELRSISSLKAHLRQHETPQAANKNQCQICKKRFTGKDQLTKHMRLKHGYSSYAHKTKVDYSDRIEEFFDMKCEQCDSKFTSLQHAKLHYFDAHNITNGYIKCCNMKFKTIGKINDHLQYHLNPELYKCPICEKILPRSCDLSQHLYFHKTLTDKRFACELCGKAFQSNFLLNKHERTHKRDSTKKISCNKCQRKFLSVQSLENHVDRTHNKSNGKEARMFLCQMCGKSFKTLASVKAHSQLVHENSNENDRKQFQCHICNRMYKTKHSLRFHIRLSHESTPQKCPKCGKLTSNPMALTRHIKIVHENETFECHLCHKQLKSSQSFKEHVATHSSECKLYKCSFCSDTFNWRSNMYIHQKKSHPEQWQNIKPLRARRAKTNSTEHS